MELYVDTVTDDHQQQRVFLCRPGVDNNVAECFETNGIPAPDAGARLANSVNAITRIMALLDDSPEWDSETMGDLANILHDEGFKLREADESEEDDGG